MKKFFFSILAVGAMVACTKSEVNYNDASEISFAPVASTATKAAINNAVFPKDKEFNVWAFYSKDNPSLNPTYGNYTKKYITDKTFKRYDSINWGGKDEHYYWPNNGSLVFAGYAAPMELTPTYDLSNDKLSIFSYTQPAIAEGYTELLWFGRTDSYNNRTTGDNVDVVFNHALSWITLQFQGLGMTANAANEWKIKKVVINEVAQTGNVECVGSTATWKDWSNKGAIEVYNDATGTQLTAAPQVIEKVSRGTLVLPQSPTTVTITYSCKTPAGDYIDEVVSADLKLNEGNTIAWENGKHYIYTITFSATEILIAPTVATWEDYNSGTPIETPAK